MPLEQYFDFLGPDDIRIKGHRLGIDDVFGYYREGYTAEEIARQFPSLRLEEIYATLKLRLVTDGGPSVHRIPIGALLPNQEGHEHKMLEQRKSLADEPKHAGRAVSERFAGTRVLITGGIGFIGSHLARRLVSLGANVLLVDSLVPEYGGNLHNIDGIEQQVQINISDVRDEHSMAYLVQGREYIFNLAGQTSHMDSMQDPFTDLEINCRAQLSILEVCRKYNPAVKIVFASTRQVYGKPDYLPVNEKHLLRPTDVNGINKMAGEWYHILYNNVYGIRTCALRLTNTYGPGMRVKDARQTFLGIWLRALVEGKPFEVWDGHQLRDFTYVDDVIDAFLVAAVSDEANGQIFNLGGNDVISLQDLAELLVDVNGRGEYNVRAFPIDRRRIDIGDYYADYSHIFSVLGWRPHIPLREGLGTTLAFYQAQLKHYL